MSLNVKSYRLVMVAIALLVYGCSGTPPVLTCAVPATQADTKYFGLNSKAYIKTSGFSTAVAQINTKIGQEIAMEFRDNPQSKWEAITATYQYQMCQTVRDSDCGTETNSLICLGQKKELLAEVYNGIISKLNGHQTRYSACISQTCGLSSDQSFSISGRVRCPGGGCWFKSDDCNQRSANVQYKAPTGSYISGYSVVQGTDQYGTTGKVTEKSDSSNNLTNIAVPISCDAPNSPGAPSGWNRLTLTGKIVATNYDQCVAQNTKICKAHVHTLAPTTAATPQKM